MISAILIIILSLLKIVASSLSVLSRNSIRYAKINNIYCRILVLIEIIILMVILIILAIVSEKGGSKFIVIINNIPETINLYIYLIL